MLLSASTLLAASTLVAAGALLAGCAGGGGAPMTDATNAYNAAEFGRSLALSRAAAERGTGLARDQARYLEGLSLLKLGRVEESIAPLAEASDAANRALAADARVSLGTALVRKGDLAGAAEAYRRASFILEGEEKQRALAVEAECNARLAAARAPSAPPRVEQPVAVAVQEEPPAPAAPSPPSPSSLSSPTARIINGVEIEPVRFAIQAGAFKDRSKAVELAAQVGPQVALEKLAPPRVIEKERGDGSTVYVVQFGSFPNRAVAGKALRAFSKTPYTVERWAE
jgi:tetratricopeptide (TPR) repeat protein